MDQTTKKILNTLSDFTKPQKRYFNISKETGKFLYNLILSSKAKNILEIGTSNGYSTIWMAQATQGKVTTIEKTDFKVKEAEQNFQKAKLNNIKIIHGDALKEIPKLKEKYDFMFIDAIKRNYIDYLKLAEKNLKNL